MSERIPVLEWRDDQYGRPRRALYLGGIYCGSIETVMLRGGWDALAVSSKGHTAVDTNLDTDDDARRCLECYVRALLQN